LSLSCKPNPIRVIPVSAARPKTGTPERQIAEMTYSVYIVTNGKCGVLYVGVTNSLERRISHHKAKEIPGFTRTHGLDRLVFFRGFGEVTEAIRFEKQLKRRRREWKIRLIETDNLHWEDLYLQMMSVGPLHPALGGPGLSLRENRDDSEREGR
jgi:putative endonuclease